MSDTHFILLLGGLNVVAGLLGCLLADWQAKRRRSSSVRSSPPNPQVSP